MGCLWSYGFEGGAVNWPEAEKWLLKAAAAGRADGHTMLGIGRLDHGLPPEEAVSAFRQVLGVFE